MTDYLLLAPFALLMGYVIAEYYVKHTFNLVRALIIMGLAEAFYVPLTIYLHTAQWYVPLIQLGIAGLFFVLSIGVLGNKTSGATLIGLMALLALIPARFFFWAMGAAFILFVVMVVVYGVKHRKEFTSLMYSTAVNAGSMDYDFLPEHKEALQQSQTRIFVPVWITVSAAVGVLAQTALTLFA